MKARVRISRISEDGQEKVVFERDYSASIVYLMERTALLEARTRRPWWLNAINDAVDRIKARAASKAKGRTTKDA